MASEDPGTGVEQAADERSRWVRPVAFALVLAVAVVGIGAAWLYLGSGDTTPEWFGGGEADVEPLEQDPLGDSGPHEAVLRSLRLAGYEEAVVGEDDGTAIVRLDAPYLNTPAHVELAWQTALASEVEAFPDAESYVAQVFSSGVALLEVRVPGDAMRDAVGSDDPARLREDANFAYLHADDARALPRAIAVLGGGEGLAARDGAGARVEDLDLSASYLDEKNRAAGLLDALGPVGADRLRETWETATSTVRPVPPADAERATVYLERLIESLAAQDAADDADGLETYAKTLAEGTGGVDAVPELKLWSEVAEAVASSDVGSSVLAGSAELTRRVLETSTPTEGPAADAIVVATGSDAAPEDARRLDDFERTPSLDAMLTAGGTLEIDETVARAAGLPVDMLEGAGSPLGSGAAAGVESGTIPADWPAYSSPAGRVLWRAGAEGSGAATDGSTRGWAYVRPRAWLVDAEHIGVVLYVAELP